MFSKKHRLAKTKDVKTAFARGRGFFNPFCTVKFFSKPNQSPRFTVIISTKVFKKAAARNRLKRVIREFIRLRMGKFSGGDYAVIVKTQAAKAEEQVILQSLKQLFLSARLIKDEN
jgi:ribonuclease P protein component